MKHAITAINSKVDGAHRARQMLKENKLLHSKEILTI